MTSKEIAEKLLELFSSRDIRVNNEIAETVTDEEFEVYQSTAIQIALKFKDIDHFHNYLFSYLLLRLYLKTKSNFCQFLES